MTKLSIIISEPISKPSKIKNFIDETKMPDGQCAPLHKSGYILDTATSAVKNSAEYQYWKSMTDAHQSHLYFGGVAA
ncbi:MAG: hypothetical protein GY710_18975 [Desulfobacteraceae bacterium]|nr:hypothetical protein [Desulfobacteraceae bacterium]